MAGPLDRPFVYVFDIRPSPCKSCGLSNDLTIHMIFQYACAMILFKLHEANGRHIEQGIGRMMLSWHVPNEYDSSFHSIDSAKTVNNLHGTSIQMRWLNMHLPDYYNGIVRTSFHSVNPSEINELKMIFKTIQDFSTRNSNQIFGLNPRTGRLHELNENEGRLAKLRMISGQ